MRQLPIIPTIVVAAAVATMIALGFWQLARKGEKEAMIARYSSAVERAGEVPFPDTPDEIESALYRRSRVVCDRVTGRRTVAGAGPDGESGLAQIVTCDLAGGGRTEIALGLSRSPEPIAWRGGAVEGYVSNAGGGAVRLVAAPPVAGLAPMARPDPRDLPNNHLAYAVQWFLFALTAVVIYGLALRRR